MKRIELFGPSGVGKSTLMSQLDDALIQKFNLLTMGSLEGQFKEIIPLVGVSNIAAWLDGAEEGRFLNECISRVASCDLRASQVVLAINMVNSTFQKYSLLPFLPEKPEIILGDEFLLHRCFVALCHSYHILEDFEWYFSYVPVPEYAIYCTASIETIAERVINRTKLVSSYMYLSDKEVVGLLEKVLPAYEKAIGILKCRGVNVYRLDMEGDTYRVQQEFMKIMHEIYE